MKQLGAWLRGYAVFLLLASTGLMIWNHLGMNRVFSLINTGFPTIALDDSGSGGKSHSSLHLNGTRLVMEAQLAKGFPWPFAELDIQIADSDQGLDLSRFDTLRVQATYRAPGNPRLRLFLRNYDPAYSKPEEVNTWKLNEADFEPKTGRVPMDIPLKNFTVATWWLTDHHIPIEQAPPDFRHIRLVQIVTAEDLGFHTVAIDRLELRGKWISREHLALGLLGTWILSGLVFLVLDLRILQRHLATSQRREQRLRDLTEALQLENKTIGEMARMDPLTGVLNRAGIRDELFDEAERSQRTGSPLSILFLDLDHFKHINDAFGHDIGDLVLQQFANQTQALIRKSDYLVRWGGEEFVILCPSTPLESAEFLAEKIRASTATSVWPTGEVHTVSIGLTSLGKEAIPASLKRADTALYAAKGRGRNQVASLPPPSAQDDREKP